MAKLHIQWWGPCVTWKTSIHLRLPELLEGKPACDFLPVRMIGLVWSSSECSPDQEWTPSVCPVRPSQSSYTAMVEVENDRLFPLPRLVQNIQSQAGKALLILLILRGPDNCKTKKCSNNCCTPLWLNPIFGRPICRVLFPLVIG